MPQGPWASIAPMGDWKDGCGVDALQHGWCWRTGSATAEEKAAPPQLPPPPGDAYRWRQLSPGSNNWSCGITAESETVADKNALYCWGVNEATGQPPGGDGAPVRMVAAGTSGVAWRQLSLNYDVACGTLYSGKLYCLGGNSSYQLGPAGAPAGQLAAVPAPSDPATPGSLAWVGAHVAEYMACGLANTEAVEGNSSLWCWGKSSMEGGTRRLAQSSATPRRISTDFWRQFALCGVLVNGTGACLVDQERVAALPDPPGGGSWAALSATNTEQGSPQLACGVASDGSAHCFGFDQSASGVPCAPAPLPAPPDGGGAAGWAQVEVGEGSFACGRTADGRIYCFALPGAGENGCFPELTAENVGWQSIEASPPAPAPPPAPPGAAPPPAPPGVVPSPPPPPAAEPPVEAASGSSAPVGAIVGGVVGGLAVLAALCLLLAWRRGWLGRNSRRQAVVPHASSKGRKGGHGGGGTDLPTGQPSAKHAGQLGSPPAGAPAAGSAGAAHASSSSLAPSAATPARLAPPLLLGAGSDPSWGQLTDAFSSSRGDTDTFISQTTAGSRGPSAGTAAGNAAVPAAWARAALGDEATWTWATEQTRSLAPTAASGGSDPLSAWSAASAAPAASWGSHGATPPQPELPELDVRHWVARFEDLELVRPLGEGSFGKVFLARWNHALCAVKLLVPEKVSEERLKQVQAATAELDPMLRREASLMAMLRHPNIVSFLAVITRPLPGIVTEYCQAGSLFDLLQTARVSPPVAAQLSWPVRLGLATDAASGMLYLHTRSPPVIHKDLKGPNVLVADGWHAKVADFNLSKTLEENLAGQALRGDARSGGDDATSQPVASNPRWLAPELLLGGRATTASDVYAFGCVLYEVLTWQLPWQNEGQYLIVGQVLAGRRPSVPPAAQLPGPGAGAWSGLPDYLTLMEACWAQEPGSRPAFSDIVPSLRKMLEQAEAELGSG